MNETAENMNADNSGSDAKSLSDFKRAYFGPSNLAKAQDIVGEIMEVADREGKDVKFNFDPENDEIPEGYGLALIPLRERAGERGTITKGFIVAALPDPDTVLSDDKGREFAQDIVQRSLMNSVASAVKTDANSIPFSLADFMASGRETMAAFNELASDYVKVLKSKGLKLLTKPILKQVLQSSEFAEQQFPRVGQDKWEYILQSMINHAKKEGMDTSILEQWLRTRDQVSIEVDDISVDDLDSLLESEAS